MRNWSVESVRSMEGVREKFAHVVKHLYRPAECWAQVLPEFGGASASALAAGAALARNLDFSTAEESCRLRVIGDHDRLYAPAYRQALLDAEAAGRFGRLGSNGHGPGWAFVDSRGVYVIVGERSTQPPNVRTAYRVTPPRSDARRPEDFFKAAVRKLHDKSSYKRKDT